jgi:flagellar biosynthesis/type III secretory pathway ATPase
MGGRQLRPHHRDREHDDHEQPFEPEHARLARRARELLSAYRDAADLVEVGAYVAGSNPKVDRALACIEGLNAFLRQGPEERTTPAEAMARLRAIVGAGAGGPRRA